MLETTETTPTEQELFDRVLDLVRSRKEQPVERFQLPRAYAEEGEPLSPLGSLIPVGERSHYTYYEASALLLERSFMAHVYPHRELIQLMEQHYLFYAEAELNDVRSPAGNSLFSPWGEWEIGMRALAGRVGLVYTPHPEARNDDEAYEAARASHTPLVEFVDALSAVGVSLSPAAVRRITDTVVEAAGLLPQVYRERWGAEFDEAVRKMQERFDKGEPA